MRLTPEMVLDLAGAAFEEAMGTIMRKTQLAPHPSDKLAIVSAALMLIASKQSVLAKSMGAEAEELIADAMGTLTAADTELFAKAKEATR